MSGRPARLRCGVLPLPRFVTLLNVSSASNVNVAVGTGNRTGERGVLRHRAGLGRVVDRHFHRSSHKVTAHSGSSRPWHCQAWSFLTTSCFRCCRGTSCVCCSNLSSSGSRSCTSCVRGSRSNSGGNCRGVTEGKILSGSGVRRASSVCWRTRRCGFVS